MTGSFAAVFVAGLLTALSPCVLPVAPILVAGLVGTRQASSRWARLRSTAWFALGFATVFVLLGLGVPAVTNALPRLRPLILSASAAIIILYGLKMTRVIGSARSLEWMDRSVGVTLVRPRRTGGLRGLALGAAFGLTWTPCAGPLLGGVLTYVAAAEGATADGALLLLAYAAGVASPLLLVAGASEHFVPLVRAFRPHVRKVEFASGIGLVAAGAILLGQAVDRGGEMLGTPWAVDQQEGALASPAEGRRLMFFHSEHCPACRAMQAFLPALERECRSNRWALVRIDVDRGENARLAERLGVRAVPTISLVDERGEEVERLVGYQSERRLRAAIERGMEVACTPAGTNRPPGAPDGDRVPACSIGTACG